MTTAGIFLLPNGTFFVELAVFLVILFILAKWILPQANRTADQVVAESQGRGQAEYERIVSSAEAEVALARQRAVDEAAARLGELVLEVVERIIGREVDLDAHRDLIDEAIAAV